MHEFQSKQKARRMLYSPVAGVAFFILLVLLVKASWGIYAKSGASVEARSISEKQYNELVERQDFINKEIKRLRTTEGVEEEIRNKFSVAKPGETMVVIVPADVPEAMPEEKSFLQKFWYNIQHKLKI